MATKSKVNVASKRTKVRNLPKAVKKVTAKDMKKVRGGDQIAQSEPGPKIIPKATLYGRKAGDDRQDY